VAPGLAVFSAAGRWSGVFGFAVAGIGEGFTEGFTEVFTEGAAL
jgi:hypothetical protein